jgi:hypothetical protein
VQALAPAEGRPKQGSRAWHFRWPRWDAAVADKPPIFSTKHEFIVYLHSARGSETRDGRSTGEQHHGLVTVHVAIDQTRAGRPGGRKPPSKMKPSGVNCNLHSAVTCVHTLQFHEDRFSNAQCTANRAAAITEHADVKQPSQIPPAQSGSSP